MLKAKHRRYIAVGFNLYKVLKYAKISYTNRNQVNVVSLGGGNFLEGNVLSWRAGYRIKLSIFQDESNWTLDIYVFHCKYFNSKNLSATHYSLDIQI